MPRGISPSSGGSIQEKSVDQVTPTSHNTTFTFSANDQSIDQTDQTLDRPPPPKTIPIPQFSTFIPLCQTTNGRQQQTPLGPKQILSQPILSPELHHPPIISPDLQQKTPTTTDKPAQPYPHLLLKGRRHHVLYRSPVMDSAGVLSKRGSLLPNPRQPSPPTKTSQPSGHPKDSPGTTHNPTPPNQPADDMATVKNSSDQPICGGSGAGPSTQPFRPRGNAGTGEGDTKLVSNKESRENPKGSDNPTGISVLLRPNPGSTTTERDMHVDDALPFSNSGEVVQSTEDAPYSVRVPTSGYCGPVGNKEGEVQQTIPNPDQLRGPPPVPSGHGEANRHSRVCPLGCMGEAPINPSGP